MSLAGKIVVFTGTLSKYTRAEAANAAKAAGATVTTQISGKTDILVSGDGPGSAYQFAESHSIPIISEAEFAKRIGSAGSAPEKAAPEKAAPKKKAASAEPAAKPSKAPAAKKGGSSLSGKKVVFTGTLTMLRSLAKSKAEAAGAIVVGSVSKNTDILVAGPGAGEKLDLAKSLGVEVWTEEQFEAAV